MKQKTSSKTVAGVGILAAATASICSTTPILALLAGVSGAASSLTWVEHGRPYLIGLSIATLAFSWYKVLSTKQPIVSCPDKICEVEKQSFLSSKIFLILITAAAIALIASPYYGIFFIQKHRKT